MAVLERSSTLIAAAYESLRSADLESAYELLDNALTEDYTNDEILFALKCIRFWHDRISRAEGLSSNFARADYILAQWSNFLTFINRIGDIKEQAVYSCRRFAFARARQYYQQMNLEERARNADTIGLKLGRCYKGLGDYTMARKYLEEALAKTKRDAAVMAELADCYELSGDSRRAKVLFREAFLINAPSVELGFLESPMIRRLISRVEALGFKGDELNYWLPIYGNIYAIFSVKRELKEQEATKLKQDIYQLENEIKENVEERALLLPKLINHYFWLVEYYVIVKEERKKIEEILLKIRLLDKQIHAYYTGASQIEAVL